MMHLARTRANAAEQIVKFAVAHRLRVVAGGIDFGQDRLAAAIHRLTSAQRVSAVEEQARLRVAQLPQPRNEAAAVVQIAGVVDPDHAAAPRAAATIKAAQRSSASAGPSASRSLRSSPYWRCGSASTASTAAANACGVARSCISSGTISRSSTKLGIV